ncbi:glycosyltransferase [Levilactobacillus brevis]
MKLVNVSLLMSVYYREKADNLQEALESVIEQTCVPKQFVIIRDGELGSDLDEVLNNFLNRYGNLIKISLVRLNHRVNLGRALNAGLRVCKYELVARMDSDDHALPRRIELQVDFFSHNSVKVLGGNIQEFTTFWNKPVSYRKVPVSPQGIRQFSRTRNPLNHMTVMFKKDFILNVMGGYRDVLGFEDYDLWLRVLKDESEAIYNLPQVLVAARTAELQNRRGGTSYVKQNAFARWVFYRDRLISLKDFLVTLSVGTLVGLSSSRFREYIYKLVLRKK